MQIETELDWQRVNMNWGWWRWLTVLCVCVFSQCAAGHGCARLRRDVPGETAAAPVWSVCLRLSSEYAQSRASIYGHQCDSLTEESKGESLHLYINRRVFDDLLFDKGVTSLLWVLWTHNITIFSLYTNVVNIFIPHIAYF